MLRPVRVARLVCQVQDVTRHVVLCGEIGQHPRLFGSSDLQPAYWAVPALAAPAKQKNSDEGGSRMCPAIKRCGVISPFINALLAEAVGAGQDEVSFPIHADAALLLIGQLLHSAAENTFSSQLLAPRHPRTSAGRCRGSKQPSRLTCQKVAADEVCGAQIECCHTPTS